MSPRLTGFSPHVRYVVSERSQGICEICGMAPAVQHHHRRCRGMGSTRRPETNLPANSLHLCAEDHAFLEVNRKDALEAGWLVSQHRTPALIPVLRRGVWVLLSDLGDVQEIPEPATGSVA